MSILKFLQIEITFENVRSKSKERAKRPRVKMSRANLISVFRLKCGPQKIEKVLLMVLQFEFIIKYNDNGVNT